MIPQLPTEVADDRLEELLGSDSWVLSQKLDGHRVLIETGTTLKRYNRHGEETTVPEGIRRSLGGLSQRWVLDGEFLDETFWIFDILELNGTNLLNSRWFMRQTAVTGFVERVNDPHVRAVPQLDLEDYKRESFTNLRDHNAEGVIFTDRNSFYKQGRTNQVLKYKFLKTVDCIVTAKGLEGKDNLEIAVMRDGVKVNVGRVSALTGDGPNIKVGDVVTVTCLYSTETGRLFHPVKPRLRTDKLPEECTFDQVEVIKLNKEVLL